MNESEARLRDLENQNNNALIYVLAIIALLLVMVYYYTQYQNTQKAKEKTVEAPATAQTKELVDVASSLKDGGATLDLAEDEGDVDSGLSTSSS